MSYQGDCEPLPNGTSRPGPKPDPVRKVHRDLLQDMSDRTFARYWRAYRILRLLDPDAESVIPDAAARRNGDLNVSKMLRIAELRLARAVVEQEETT